MNIIIYEDNKTAHLKPFSINHATFELQSGVMTNLDRIKYYYGSHDDDMQFILLVRSEIESIITFRYPDMIVNPKTIPKGKYINGRFLLKRQADLDIFPEKPTDDDLINDALISLRYTWDPIFLFKEIFPSLVVIHPLLYALRITSPIAVIMLFYLHSVPYTHKLFGFQLLSLV